MKQHPEQLEDEIYLGNYKTDNVCKSSWRTSRRGKVALRRDGNPCNNPCNNPNEDFRPWFIKVEEVEMAIKEECLANAPSESRIKTLQSLVDNRRIVESDEMRE